MNTILVVDDQREIRELVNMVGADDCFEKPFSPLELMGKVSKLLDGQ